MRRLILTVLVLGVAFTGTQAKAETTVTTATDTATTIQAKKKVVKKAKKKVLVAQPAGNAYGLKK